MEESNFFARPPIGTRHTLNMGWGDLQGVGVYFVEITEYVAGLPVCIILKVLEKPLDYVNEHPVGKRIFFITRQSDDPNEIMKEIL